MTDVIGPFDGINWTQDAWYRHAPKWAPSGVNGTPAASTTTGDLPITFSGLNFTVGIGRGWVRGAGFERSGTPSSQAIAANTNASLFRRDRVVLRRDLAAKTVAPVLIQGTPSASPTAPAIQRVETGQWDDPLFSFLTPPNSGTSITSIVDERAWANGGPVVVPSLAVRDAHFPSPTGGEQCLCLSPNALMTHDGTAWRFTLSGTGTGNSDVNGFLSATHGAGQAPVRWIAALPFQATDSINTIVGVLGWSSDATNVTARFVRNDTHAYFSNPLTFTWWAQF